MSFTPGPWAGPTYSNHGNDYWCIGFSTPHIAVAKREEDARLICAAPDLLAVAQELAESAAYWSEYDVPLGIVDRINSAIAKAIGP